MPPNRSPGNIPPKRERLLEFFERLKRRYERDPPNTYEAARELQEVELNRVEDERTGLPNEPARYKEIPRLFPVQDDNIEIVPGTTIKRLQSLRHVTYIAPNGAMLIRTWLPVNGKIQEHLSLKGSDGKSVCDICPDLAEKNL